jgi:integrase
MKKQKKIAKKSREPKLCQSCEKKISYTNFSKHQQNCGKNKDDKSEEKRKKLEEENAQLQKKIDELESENAHLRSLLKEEKKEIFTVDSIIKSKKSNTQTSYRRTWDEYLLWCEENKAEPNSRTSCLDYFNDLCNPLPKTKRLKFTSLKTVRSVLMIFFKSLYQKDVTGILPKPDSRGDEKKLKYVIPDDVLLNFFCNMKKIEDFLFYYILLISGCRNHSLAMLKRKNCNNEIINYYDFKKSKSYSVEIMSKVVKEIFILFLNSKNPEEFVFYPPYFRKSKYTDKQEMLEKMKIDSEIVKKRSKYVSQIIQKQIKDSECFDHVDDKTICLGPHMFRKTKAVEAYNVAMNFSLGVSRMGIKHEAKTNSIFDYVIPHSMEMEIHKNLLNQIDNYLIKEDNYGIRTGLPAFQDEVVDIEKKD